MGHRLSKIYTRTGDAGTTGLGDGTRVAKDDLRVDAYGTVDEANSAVGLVLAHSDDGEVNECLTDVQHDLFDLGGELCLPGHRAIGSGHIDRLEERLDAFNAELPPLKDFVLPAGGPAASSAHLARTICRRAERRVVSLAGETEVNPEAIRYLNRLSDLLFVVARRLARATGEGEVLWQQDRRR